MNHQRANVQIAAPEELTEEQLDWVAGGRDSSTIDFGNSISTFDEPLVGTIEEFDPEIGLLDIAFGSTRTVEEVGVEIEFDIIEAQRQ